MSLTTAEARRKLHTRNIVCEGFEREDGLFEIEARIVDTKTFAFEHFMRGHVDAGTPVHDMQLRLTLDIDMTVRDIAVITFAAPYAACSTVYETFQKLIGANLRHGWRRTVTEAVGGTGSCTHLRELLLPAATVAFQTMVGQSAILEAQASGKTEAPVRRISLIGVKAGRRMAMPYGRYCPLSTQDLIILLRLVPRAAETVSGAVHAAMCLASIKEWRLQIVKKSFGTFIVTMTAALSAASAMAADPFPSRPIKIVTNTAPGGQLDVYARLMAQEMSKVLGQPVIVENKAGADGLIGIRYVKSAPADGYIILAASNTFAQNPALKGDAGYDVARDFVGIGMISQSPLIMVTASSNTEKSVADVIASAKANPGKLSYASGGVGTSTHMAAALFLMHAEVKMLHVPYKGNAASQSDVLSGRININFDGASTAIPHVKEGRLRALGLTTSKRSASFPDIPTLAEQGLPKYEFMNYFGLHVPAVTPKEVVVRLNEAMRVAQNSEAARDRFQRDGAEARIMTSDEFTAFVREDAKVTAQTARELGLQKD